MVGPKLLAVIVSLRSGGGEGLLVGATPRAPAVDIREESSCAERAGAREQISPCSFSARRVPATATCGRLEGRREGAAGNAQREHAAARSLLTLNA